MASVFGHAMVAVTVGHTICPDESSKRFWLLAVTCSIIPDADVLAFSFGIPYHHPIGHRGFTHSLCFALIWAILLTAIAYPKALKSIRGWKIALSFAIITASHGLLDAMTNGGLGIALLAPFDHTRYFLPIRPILVSPIGIRNFLSQWGWAVIQSETYYIGLPCILWIGLLSIKKNFSRPKT